MPTFHKIASSIVQQFKVAATASVCMSSHRLRHRRLGGRVPKLARPCTGTDKDSRKSELRLIPRLKLDSEE